MQIRHPESRDYLLIIQVVDAWWGGRHMADMLPKLFFEHFRTTSFIVEQEGQIIGFLIGFLSQTFSDQAYIHFVGIHPDHRQHGIGRLLYERFFEAAKSQGRSIVSCVTSPVNTRSIQFHLAMGFTPEAGPAEASGIAYFPDYDGPDGDRVVFRKHLFSDAKH